MAVNYTGSPTGVQSPGVAPSLTALPVANVPSDGDSLNAASVVQGIREAMDFIAYLQARARDLIFGNGSDGVGSYTTGTTTLGRDMYFSSLTIATGATLVTYGYAIYCTGAVVINGTLSGTGTNASSASGGFNPGPHACGGPDGTPNTNSTITSATLAGPFANYAPDGGYGNGYAGCTGVQVNSSGLSYKMYPYRTGPVQLGSGKLAGIQLDYLRGGGAGGFGGGDGTNYGGGGGAGGALVVVIASSITIASGANVVSNGSAGASPPLGNTGGGSGGCGGAFLFVCQSYSSAGTFSAAGGGGGLKHGTGSSNGSSAMAGNTTPYIVYVP